MDVTTQYITESWLAENVHLSEGGEVRLPTSCRLTPAARDVLAERNIRVRYTDEVGRVFVAAGSDDQLSRVHPLTNNNQRETAQCLLCQQEVKTKPGSMTHLNATTLVAKNDARIVLRGRVDTAIAHAVLLQAEWQSASLAASLQKMLADVRAALGNVLRSEVLNEPMPPITLGDFNTDQIHLISHNPLQHLGHDHIVPALEHGLAVARLNLLRSVIREAEVSAAQAFINKDFSISREDILQALNRLSSAVYVLMLITWIGEKSGRKS
ncbi:MAG: ethanolamine utilization cob(I)yrinic acid a,c-diamide adenosyltransferase EutT [Betaproteobacteria bacterium]